MSKRYQELYNDRLLKINTSLQTKYAVFFSKFGKLAVSAAVALSVTACGHSVKHKTVETTDWNGHVKGYVGSIAADEPQAAMVARDILIRGGNAADAAVALGYALTVTLPSRASLGGGGACIAYRPGQAAQSFLFIPQPGGSTGRVDRPASIPMMARGLYLLQSAYGHADINDIFAVVGSLAQNGITVSNAFSSDLAAVQQGLFADPAVKKLFTHNDGSILQAGDTLYQPKLKVIYDRFISAGVSDLYVGSLARSYALGAQAAGGGLLVSDFRNALPVSVPALSYTQNGRVTYFVSPPADGGLGMAMALRSFENGKGDANSVAQGTVAKWRSEHALVFNKQGIETDNKAAQSWIAQDHSGNGSLSSLPASTSFAVVDRDGMAVSCALTMNNLFGTGRVAGTTGIVMGASPKIFPAPLLTAAISTYKQRFVAAIAASGQNDAAGAAAEVLSSLLSNMNHKGDADINHVGATMGRVNAVYCVNGDMDKCRASTDSKGMGLAISQR